MQMTHMIPKLRSILNKFFDFSSFCVLAFLEALIKKNEREKKKSCNHWKILCCGKFVVLKKKKKTKKHESSLNISRLTFTFTLSCLYIFLYLYVLISITVLCFSWMFFFVPFHVAFAAYKYIAQSQMISKLSMCECSTLIFLPVYQNILMLLSGLCLHFFLARIQHSLFILCFQSNLIWSIQCCSNAYIKTKIGRSPFSLHHVFFVDVYIFFFLYNMK